MTSPLNIDPTQMGLLSASPATQAAIAQILADPNQMTTITGQNKGGSNAWLWQPTEQNTKYQDYLFGGQNNYMTGEVAKYLQALGYSGNAPGGGNISDQDASAINDFLKARGLSVQTGTHQVPGYSQYTGIQRIVDANGVPVAVDARNNRYDANDRFTDLGKAAAMAAAGYGLGQAAGLWGGAGEAAGGAAAIPGSAGDYALGVFNGATPATEFGASTLFNTAPALTGTAGDAALAAFNGAGGLTAPSIFEGGSLLSGLGSAAQTASTGKSVMDTIKGAGDALSSGAGLAGLAGAALGAASGGGNTTATSQSKTDPRIDPYIYGNGGYLQSLQAKFNQNPSGINSTMQQALDIGKANLTDPQYAQTYQNMRSFGNGLLAQPMAANPFTAGQGGQVQSPGLLADFNARAKNLMAKGGGLLG